MMKQQFFLFLAVIVMISSVIEAEKGKEFMANIKEKLNEVKEKVKSSWNKLTSMSEYACPVIEKWCEDHCEAKKAIGKCDDTKCKCLKLPK
uniref:Potassium channel blocker AbKTx-5 n=2 Tax=Androctonus bicolor TaxID=748906 RepID=A0A0K0LCJ0_9SCOR|nr:potassium channel blocker AbKTx-5 [Androctonus bicolor]AIX87694.1 potassium channel blocker AbKTx-5 [Androctonus bicolor]